MNYDSSGMLILYTNTTTREVMMCVRYDSNEAMSEE
jgi:hypothetical protein